MPIMPGITLGEAQSAQLAFINQFQMCSLCVPKGNTDDTPVLINALIPELKWQFWMLSYNARGVSYIL